MNTRFIVRIVIHIIFFFIKIYYYHVLANKPKTILRIYYQIKDNISKYLKSFRIHQCIDNAMRIQIDILIVRFAYAVSFFLF